MSKITKVKKINKIDIASVYIDYRYCGSFRSDIWEAMGLKEGDKITRSKLYQREREILHKARANTSIHGFQYAIGKIKQWVDKYLPNIEAKIIEYKNNNNLNEGIDYPSKRYDQNISLYLKGTTTELITLEVATTEIQKGLTHWINVEKIKHVQSQTRRDRWIVLYYRYPLENFVWVKPNILTKYCEEEIINGTGKFYVSFYSNSAEVYTTKKFLEHIQNKIAPGPISSTTNSKNGLSEYCGYPYKLLYDNNNK